MDRVDNTVPRHTKYTIRDLEDEIRALRIRVERLELMVNRPYKPDLTYKAVDNKEWKV